LYEFARSNNVPVIYLFEALIIRNILQDDIKVIAATNRIDILDPALLRSGRLDRKIEFPAPTEEARARIMQIHARYRLLYR
jgi:SpoVK/Ycf46/Vps4 family AAA+-type ATPase